MPQLDVMSFCSQAFWLLIGFFSVYFYLLNSIIPILAQNIKFRQKKLQVFSKLNESTVSLYSNNSLTLVQSLCSFAKVTFSQAMSFYIDWFQHESEKYKNLVFFEVNKTHLIGYNNNWLKQKLEIKNLKL